MIEQIAWKGKPLAYIIKADTNPEKTTFLTPPELNLQVGYIVHPAGHAVLPHTHRSLERHIVGTSEVLVVRDGLCEVDIYNDDRQLVATRELGVGAIAIFVHGGHGLRFLKDTVLLEVKQGPYQGMDEKEQF